jgi:uncharacterized membrane protein
LKLFTLLMCLAPFLFLPLGSPLLLLIVPLILVRFLSSSPAHWGTSFHYGAPLSPILAMAAGDGLARLRQRIGDADVRRRVTAGLVWTSVAVAAFAPGHQEHWRLIRPAIYRFTSSDDAGERAVAVIPPAASVVAQTAILPHLSERDRAFNLTTDAPDADYFIAAIGVDPWPLPDAGAVQREIDARRARGYSTVFAQSGWIVLKR